jgi:hypothetical protein
MSFFDRLLGREKARHQSLRKRLEATIVALADGKEPDAETVDQLLVALGKTAADLEAAVALVVKRRQARAAADRAEKVPAERSKIESQIHAANDTLTRAVRQAEEKHAAVVIPLRQRLVELAVIEKAGGDGLKLLDETGIASDEDAAELGRLRGVLEALRPKYNREANAAHDAGQQAQESATFATEIEAGRMSRIGHNAALAVAEARTKAAVATDTEKEHANRRDALAAEMREIEGKIAAVEAKRLQVA